MKHKKLFKRVVHLTSVHTPFDTRIFHRECKSLLEISEQVILIAPFEKNEFVDGIEVHAVPRPRTRAERVLKTTWQVLLAAIRERSPVYHFHDPELIPVGVLLKLGGKKVIYDVHEDVAADMMDKYWIPRRLRKPLSKLYSLIQFLTSNFFDAIIAATPKIADKFPERKTYLVQNFPRKNEMKAQGIFYHDRPHKIIYVGSITTIRGIHEMVQAISLIPEHYGVELVLVGEFSPPSLKQEIEVLEGWGKVNYLGWQSREIVGDLLNQAKVGLVVFHPTANHLEAQPNKLFEYMNAALPVVASNFPMWDKFVQETNCGITVNPLNPVEIAQGIQWMLDHPEEAMQMGRLGQRSIDSHYNWEHESTVLRHAYERLVN